MREIKFRAWDKNHKCMHYSNDCTLDWLFDLPKRHGGAIMQFTGLEDKNGKEIYEGDIIKAEESVFQYKNPLEVKFGFYHPLDEIEYGWYVRGKFESSLVWEERTTLDYLEVIGNIYENSKLLDKP